MQDPQVIGAQLTVSGAARQGEQPLRLREAFL
jgi:hypothetical protein